MARLPSTRGLSVLTLREASIVVTALKQFLGRQLEHLHTATLLEQNHIRGKLAPGL